MFDATSTLKLGVGYFQTQISGNKFRPLIGFLAQFDDVVGNLGKYSFASNQFHHARGNVVLQGNPHNAADGDGGEYPHEQAGQAASPMKARVKQDQ